MIALTLALKIRGYKKSPLALALGLFKVSCSKPSAGENIGAMEVAMDDQKTVGRGVLFERIRRLWYHRLLAYLVGTLDRFNNAKRAEERDRVKHTHLDDWRSEDGDS